MAVQTVFLSYASEDQWWKDSFTDDSWFNLGNVKVEDYLMGGNLPFGHLKEWLNEQINGAAVFVAIVSQNYINKKYPLAEWAAGLSATARQKIVFVPILIDAEAKSWWSEQKKSENLRDLGDDYAYSDFTNSYGQPCTIRADFGPVDSVTRRIAELSRLIREHLRKEQNIGGAVPKVGDAKPSPDSEVGRPVILLGHPTLDITDEITRRTDELFVKLNGLGNIVTKRWLNRWNSSQNIRKDFGILISQKGIFVQPLRLTDAGLYALAPRLTLEWLEGAATSDAPTAAADLASCRVVLWLPSDMHDPAFEEATNSAENETNPILRHDDLDTLVDWLRDQARDTRPTIPILTLAEDLVDLKDSIALRRALHAAFSKVIEEVVQPAPELWTFSGEVLIDQLKSLDSERVILAIHDLNTGAARDWKTARKELETKLAAISSVIDDAVNKANRSDLKIFRSSLLVAKADQLPWVKYPAPSQFEKWCLLPFYRSSDGALQPKPAYASIFQSYLREWANPD